MAIFRHFLRRRLAVVLTCCILVITLLLSAQLALRGAKAQGGTSPSAPPAVDCQAGQPCTFLASAGFSATQGQDQWSYLYSQDQETTFTPMTYDSTNTRWFGSEGGRSEEHTS